MLGKIRLEAEPFLQFRPHEGNARAASDEDEFFNGGRAFLRGLGEGASTDRPGAIDQGQGELLETFTGDFDS